ncbi:TorD/DmsD family molecular chaperone [Undibacterium sp. SXout7W]|uniref:TorD/DmsD family molecular chaperone n=1 Tax=Undibacterium sp. SXout7W TaxID=3413049 RepID=UPI003BF32056
MTTTSQTIKFETADQGEETARADLYGLLATLFYAAPSADLLSVLTSANTDGDGVLGDAWADLIQLARTMNATQIYDEYESLFIGTGKPEILLYGSFYLSGFLMEKPLAALRADLHQLGLERAGHMAETEDHIASLCEVMRYLIASDDILQANLTVQKQFFSAHLQAWVMELCDVIINHPRAKFYAVLAQLSKAFFAIEMQAFDME